MIRASLYITACSTKNRILARLRRLREPRYMLGAIAGAAYMYFAVFMRIMGPASRRRGRPDRPDVRDALATFGPAAGGLVLLFVAASAWLVPMSSRLFEFSDAETQFLFPAPVTRRELLIHRLIRSQLGLLFAAVISSFVVTAPVLSSAIGFTSVAARVARALGMWVLFITLRVYFAGVTVARPHLLSRDGRVRVVAWLPVLVVVGATGFVGLSVARSLMAAPPQSIRELVENVLRITGTGVSHMVMMPVTAMLRPVFFDSAGDYVRGLRDALIVLAVVIVWVVRSDAVLHAAEEMPQPQTPAARAAIAARPRVGRLGWTLALTGRPEGAFFWKNGMQTLRHTSLVGILPYLLPIVMFTVIGTTARLGATDARGPAAGLVVASLMIAGFLTVLGPQTARGDLRGDLRHLEVLKTWPVKPAALIRGEMLWPAVSLTAAVWCALMCATIFSAAAFPSLTMIARVSLGTAAMVLAPALVFAQFTVQNAAAVVFPSWVAVGSQRPRGLDAMGQRLILFGGVLLALIVMVGPGAIAGGLLAFVFYRWIGFVVAIPAALVCLAIVAVEVLLATEALGPVYERIDLSQVERPE